MGNGKKRFYTAGVSGVVDAESNPLFELHVHCFFSVSDEINTSRSCPWLGAYADQPPSPPLVLPQIAGVHQKLAGCLKQKLETPNPKPKPLASPTPAGNLESSNTGLSLPTQEDGYCCCCC